MTDMKLPKLPDRTPVKITFTASPSLAKSLATFAEYYTEVYGQAESVHELVPYALEAFLESDRGFLKFRREREARTKLSTDGRTPAASRRARSPSAETSPTTS